VAVPPPGTPCTPPALAALSGGMPGRLGAELAERLVAILRDRAQGGGAASAALDELLAKGNPVAQLVAQLLQAHTGAGGAPTPTAPAGEAPARGDSDASSGSDDATAAWHHQQQQLAAAAGQADAVRHMLARLQAASAAQNQTTAAQQLQAAQQHGVLDAAHLARLSAVLRDTGVGSPCAAAAALGGLHPGAAARMVVALRERDATALAAQQQQQAAALAAAGVAVPREQAVLLQLLHEREAFQQQQQAAAAIAAASHNPLAEALARISAAQAGDDVAGAAAHGALPPAQAQALLSAVQRLGIKLPGVCFSGCGLVHRTRKGRSPRGPRGAQQLAGCLHEQGILGGEDEEAAGTASPSAMGAAVLPQIAAALSAAAATQGPNGVAWLQEQLAALQQQPELAAAFATALGHVRQPQASPPPASSARPMGTGGAPLWRGGRGGTGSMGGGGRGGGRGRGAKRSRDASASPADVPAAAAEPARSRRKAFVPTRTL
jgi:hypothetical protein